MNAAQTTAAVSTALSVAVDALIAARAAQATLQQAQSEGWTADDPRWEDPFSKIDDALKAAKARL